MKYLNYEDSTSVQEVIDKDGGYLYTVTDTRTVTQTRLDTYKEELRAKIAEKDALLIERDALASKLNEIESQGVAL